MFGVWAYPVMTQMLVVRHWRRLHGRRFRRLTARGRGDGGVMTGWLGGMWALRLGRLRLKLDLVRGDGFGLVCGLRLPCGFELGAAAGVGSGLRLGLGGHGLGLICGLGLPRGFDLTPSARVGGANLALALDLGLAIRGQLGLLRDLRLAGGVNRGARVWASSWAWRAAAASACMGWTGASGCCCGFGPCPNSSPRLGPRVAGVCPAAIARARARCATCWSLTDCAKRAPSDSRR